MEKAFSCGKTGKWPEKRRTGKRANEIECPEKGKGKAPDLKSRARFTQPPAGQSWPPWACLACLLAVSGRDVVAKVFAKDSRPIVLYDGVCNLCNGGVNFALDADRSGRLRFAALQSRRAAAG